MNGTVSGARAACVRSSVLLVLLLAATTACAQVTGEASAPALVQSTLQSARRPLVPGASLTRERAVLAPLYRSREFAPLWSGDAGATTQARAMVSALRGAGDYGLRPGDYGAQDLRERLARLDNAPRPAARAAFDLRLSAAALRLVDDLHYGRVDAREAGFEIGTGPPAIDAAAVLARLARAADTRAVLAAVEPPFRHYRLLLAQLARYRALATDPALTRLPPLPARLVRRGESYAGIPRLRRLLAALGDLPVSLATDTGTVLDAPLAEALTRYQARHGLEPDAILGPATFAQLTRPLAYRVRQIVLTLERWRWLPYFDAPSIVVNIPQFRLYAFAGPGDSEAGMLRMNVIVGGVYPRTRTPVFSGKLRYVVFRPYWDVPYSITKREMLPQIHADPAYLATHDLQIVDGPGDTATVVAPTPRAIAALATGRLRLRQRPGPDNALGLVKFIFPNAHNVYLHATPAHSLFSKARRDLSHGCIRVADPVALARYVLRNADTEWTRSRIEAAMHGTHTERVDLVTPVPVYILYGTAVAAEDGRALFFNDIYGQDRRLSRLLSLAPVGAGVSGESTSPGAPRS